MTLGRFRSRVTTDLSSLRSLDARLRDPRDPRHARGLPHIVAPVTRGRPQPTRTPASEGARSDAAFQFNYSSSCAQACAPGSTCLPRSPLGLDRTFPARRLAQLPLPALLRQVCRSTLARTPTGYPPGRAGSDLRQRADSACEGASFFRRSPSPALWRREQGAVRACSRVQGASGRSPPGGRHRFFEAGELTLRAGRRATRIRQRQVARQLSEKPSRPLSRGSRVLPVNLRTTHSSRTTPRHASTCLPLADACSSLHTLQRGYLDSSRWLEFAPHRQLPELTLIIRSRQ